MNLTKLQNDTISQMISHDDISVNLSEKFKQKIIKAGVVSVLAVTAFCSSGFAYADNGSKALGITSGLGAFTGLILDGYKPADIPADCNVQGTNGWKVGGAGVAGGYALNQIGSGNGKAAATVLGSYMAATVAQNVENKRMRAECLDQQAARQRQQAYANNNAYPSNSYNSQAPQAMILYAVQNANGVPIYVTVNDSPGLASLKGQIRGNLDPMNYESVKNDLDKSLSNMVQAYENLDVNAKNFVKFIQSGENAVNTYEIKSGRIPANSQKEKLEQEQNKFLESFSYYAKTRSIFAQNADNAATSGFNLSGYGHAVKMMAAPDSVQVAYNGKNVNRYQTFSNNFANR